MDHAQVLQKTYLFKDMPPKEVQKLAIVAVEQQFPPQTTVFREGEPGGELFVIVLGSVKVLKRDKSGEVEEVATLGSGSYFGEMAIIAEDHKRTATVESQEHTILLSFQQQQLMALCNGDDRFAHHFYRAVAQGLERRLRTATFDAAHYRALALVHRD